MFLLESFDYSTSLRALSGTCRVPELWCVGKGYLVRASVCCILKWISCWSISLRTFSTSSRVFCSSLTASTWLLNKKEGDVSGVCGRGTSTFVGRKLVPSTVLPCSGQPPLTSSWYVPARCSADSFPPVSASALWGGSEDARWILQIKATNFHHYFIIVPT